MQCVQLTCGIEERPESKLVKIGEWGAYIATQKKIVSKDVTSWVGILRSDCSVYTAQCHRRPGLEYDETCILPTIVVASWGRPSRQVSTFSLGGIPR
jgi:hypothetical protein